MILNSCIPQLTESDRILIGNYRNLMLDEYSLAENVSDDEGVVHAPPIPAKTEYSYQDVDGGPLEVTEDHYDEIGFGSGLSIILCV